MLEPMGTENRRDDSPGLGGRTDAEVLAERARLLARPFETAGPGDVASQFLALDAGDARLALPIGSVTTVLAPVRPTPVPGTPGWLAGAIQVRGQVVAVVEPDRFLGAQGVGDGADRVTVVVIRVGEKEIGLLVDRIGRIEDAAGAALTPLPDGIPELVAAVVRGTVGGRHLLDVEGFVSEIGQILRPTSDDPGRQEDRRFSPN